MEKNKDILTERIIGCCFQVHNELGPGFNEKIYHRVLVICLDKESLNYETEKQYNVNFNGNRVGVLRVDLVINNQVIVEIKALCGNVPLVFNYQILSY